MFESGLRNGIAGRSTCSQRTRENRHKRLQGLNVRSFCETEIRAVGIDTPDRVSSGRLQARSSDDRRGLSEIRNTLHQHGVRSFCETESWPSVSTRLIAYQADDFKHDPATIGEVIRKCVTRCTKMACARFAKRKSRAGSKTFGIVRRNPARSNDSVLGRSGFRFGIPLRKFRSLAIRCQKAHFGDFPPIRQSNTIS